MNGVAWKTGRSVRGETSFTSFIGKVYSLFHERQIRAENEEMLEGVEHDTRCMWAGRRERPYFSFTAKRLEKHVHGFVNA